MKFSANGKDIAITNEYTYLGIAFKPSGSVTKAVQELHSKANKAWHSIRNILYEDRKMPVSRAIQLFDSLVLPVSLYGCEVWTPFSVPKSCFESTDSMLNAWEGFQPELLNQRLCRLVLSVQKKASRLAVLGELGRFPVFFNAAIHCLKYEWHIAKQADSTSLLAGSFREMQELACQSIDCWVGRMKGIRELLGVPDLTSYTSTFAVAKKLKSVVQGSFQCFWLKQINKVRKFCAEGQDRNKLRLYKQFKGSFTMEPYLELVRNRNQRSSLTRIRISAHHLAIETGRWARPKPTPIEDRLCRFCSSEAIDSEEHFLLQCPTFLEKRNCFFGKLGSLLPGLDKLSEKARLHTILCPTSAVTTKLVNKYVLIMFEAREQIQNGEHISSMTFPPVIPFTSMEDNLGNLSVSDDFEGSLSTSGSEASLVDLDFVESV